VLVASSFKRFFDWRIFNYSFLWNILFVCLIERLSWKIPEVTSIVIEIANVNGEV